MRAQPAPNAPRINVKRAILVGVLGFICWKGGLLLYDRYFRSDEDHIRALFQSAVDGANERSPRSVTAILAEDFKGPEGTDKATIHQFCIRVLMQEFRAVEIGLNPQPLQVRIDPNDSKMATVVFKVHALGKTDVGAPWEPIARQYNESSNTQLKARLKKTPGGWRIDLVEVVTER